MTQIMTADGIVKTTDFTAFRIKQVPLFTGTTGDTGTTGAMTPPEMAAHIWQFRPVWREVAEKQEWPVEIRVEGKHDGQWHTATILSPRTLNPINWEVWSSLEDLGLDVEAAIIAAMDREEAEGHLTWQTVPVDIIETVTARDGGIDIDCGAAGQFRLGRDGYIY